MRPAAIIERERDGLIAELRGIAGDGDGDLTAEERAKVDELRGRVEELEGDATRARFIEGLQTRAANEGDDVHSLDDGDGDEPKEYREAMRNFSLLKAVGHEMGIRRADDVGLEVEVMQEMRARDGVEYEGIPIPVKSLATRANITTAAATGGGLVQTEFRPQNFIEALRAALVMDRAGATILTDLRGSVTIPSQTGIATAGWAAEDAAIAQSDPVFGSKTMSAKKVGMFTSLTREVIRQANPDVERLVAADFAYGIARAVDLAALIGGGTNEPSGVGAGTATTGPGSRTNGRIIDRTEVLHMILEVDEEDVPEDSRAWIMNSKTMAKLFEVGRNTNANNTTPEGSLIDSRAVRSQMTMYGDRVVRSNLVKGDNTKGNRSTLSHLYYGNWSGLLIGYWGGLDVLPNPFESTAYKAGSVLIRGLLNADIVIRNTKEQIFINDVATELTTN